MESAPRHQCMIYDGSAIRHLTGLATLARERLKANYRCMYLNSPAMVAAMRSQLTAAGVDAQRELDKGALILSSDRDHLLSDRFDVDLMLGMLTCAVRQALDDGYNGLWASGDMAWEFGGEKNFSRLLEYEHALQDVFEREPALSGVCQYNMETLPNDVIQWGLWTHHAVYINEMVWQANPYYEPAKLLTHRRSDVSRNELKGMLARCPA